MYTQKTIITQKITNNRLDWERRISHEIVVPSLIVGNIDDVRNGEHIAIECDVDGVICAGKGLHNFIELRNARVPTWIMDNHNHAFYFWHEALRSGRIQPGSLLVHIDQHTDLATPQSFPKQKREKINKNEGLLFSEDLEEVHVYTNTVLTIADFIVPALQTGIISEAYMITGESADGAGTFVWHDDILVRKNVSYVADENIKLQKPSIILDLDLDYFSQGFDDHICLQNVINWIQRADIVTIATSPLFIDSNRAFSYLQKLQQYLVRP